MLAALPADVPRAEQAAATLRRDGQIRIWWGDTPLDLFLNTTDFHERAATRTRWERFADRPIPFLSCHDIAVFKAFFNRTKDWADLEAMQEAGTLDLPAVTAVLIEYLGSDDDRVRRLNEVASIEPKEPQS